MRSPLLTTAIAVLAAAALAACGGDSGSDSTSESSTSADASGTLAVGGCAASVDPQTTLDVKPVDCSDPSAEYTITEVGTDVNELGSCDYGVQMSDQAYCMDVVGTPPSGPELDYSTLAEGDCTDASVDDAEPTQVLSCDDPGATSKVIGFAEAPSDCTGNVTASRDGVVVCMESQ